MIKCPGKLSTRIARLTTSKLYWHSVISTEEAEFAVLDVEVFYLEMPLKRYK